MKRMKRKTDLTSDGEWIKDKTWGTNRKITIQK